MMQLEWKRHQSVSVNGVEELDAAIEAIEDDPERPEPVLAFLIGPAGFLTIGLGHPEVGVLMYGTHDRKEPLHAIGDEPARAAGEMLPLLTFSSYGRPVRFAKWCGLPKETTKRAARVFLQQRGLLWSGIHWEAEENVPQQRD